VRCKGNDAADPSDNSWSSDGSGRRGSAAHVRYVLRFQLSRHAKCGAGLLACIARAVLTAEVVVNGYEKGGLLFLFLARFRERRPGFGDERVLYVCRWKRVMICFVIIIEAVYGGWSLFRPVHISITTYLC